MSTPKPGFLSTKLAQSVLTPRNPGAFQGWQVGARGKHQAWPQSSSGQAVPGPTPIPSWGPFITQVWGRVHGNPRLLLHSHSLLLWPSGSITREGTGTLRSPPLSRRHRACMQTQCAENSSRIPAPKDISLPPPFSKVKRRKSFIGPKSSLDQTPRRLSLGPSFRLRN